MDYSVMLNDITSNLSVKILKCFCIKHDSSWVEKKTKTDYTLWNITEGNLWIKINSNTFFVQKGDIIFFYPGNKYTAWTDENGCQFFFTMFKLEMGNSIDLLSNINLAGIIEKKYIKNKSNQFYKQFIKLYTTAQHVPFKLYVVFLNYLYEVIELAKSNHCIHFYTQMNTITSPSMQFIIDYINEHFGENISAKQLANLAELSEKCFISKFKAMVGVPPKQYITMCRMRKAAELITDTDKKINEIAHILGYADQYAFSKAFRKYYEESPINFRKKIIK